MESDKRPRITPENEVAFLTYMQRGYHEWLKRRPDEKVIYGAELEKWALDYIAEYKGKKPNLAHPVGWVMESFGVTYGNEEDSRSKMAVLSDGGWGGRLPLISVKDMDYVISVKPQDPKVAAN